MEDLKKVSIMQIYMLWRNLTVALVMIIVMFSLSIIMPVYLSPIVSLLSAAVLYTYIHNNRVSHSGNCMLIPYAVFLMLISYSLCVVVFNLMASWNVIYISEEFIFYKRPFAPVLFFAPIAEIVLVVLWFRRHNLAFCTECRLSNGNIIERGKLGSIINSESHYQLKNLICLFLIINIVIWFYYSKYFVRISINARDSYIFNWFSLIIFLIDDIFFMMRYYNLYLDLKEHDEIISQNELLEMTSKIYLRYYVVCGNSIYVNKEASDLEHPEIKVIDTPFFIRRITEMVSLQDVRRIIVDMTGVNNGELRFFYGRRYSDLEKRKVIRYFYFLDGNPEDYPQLATKGEWMDYDEVKYLYSKQPYKLAKISLIDTSRVATIILTEKTYNSEGYRKYRIKSYNPTFSLEDIRNSKLDFQDDKWIRISLFNSDLRFYRIRKWWKRMLASILKRRSWGQM